MKLRNHKKATRRRDSRIAAWERLPLEDKRATKRPGSLNPKKGS